MVFTVTVSQNRFLVHEAAVAAQTRDFSIEDLPINSGESIGLEIDYVKVTLQTLAVAALRRPKLDVMIAVPVTHRTWLARDTQTILLTETWLAERDQDSVSGPLDGVHRDRLSPLFLLTSVAQFLRLSILNVQVGDVLSNLTIGGRIIPKWSNMTQVLAIS